MKFLSGFLFSIVLSAQQIPLDSHFVRAIKFVESGHREGAIIGDNGKARGPLQIHFVCWKDAVSYNPTLTNPGYTSCSNLNYSIQIMTAYLNRYEQKAIVTKDFERLARCWNGGPNWRIKPHKTDKYWKKVHETLKKLK